MSEHYSIKPAHQVIGNFTRKHKWGVFLTFVLTVMSQLVSAQSGSTGSTFVHTGGEKGIFRQHNFQNGTGTISAGIIGSERQPALGIYSFVNPNGSWVNASDQAFVDGYVRTYNAGPFTFPIGDNGKYRPAAVSASSGSAPTTAAYFGIDPGLATTSNLKGGTHGVLPSGGPFPTTSKAASVHTVNNVEYWDIDGTTPARITLTWDAATPIGAMVGTDLNKLTIVGWNGTEWEVIPSTVDASSLLLNTSASAFTGPAGTVSAGSITTNADVVPGSFTVYTLAGTADCDLTVTASASQTAICVGQNISLTSTVSGNGGAVTYAWTGPNGFTSNVANPTLPSATTAMAGVYTLTVTDPTISTTCITTAAVSISVGSLSVYATSNSPVCSTGSLSLTAVAGGGNGSYTYAWSGPNGFSSSVASPTVALSTTAQSGTYMLTVTDTQGCSGAASTSVVVTNQPNLSISGSPSLTICSGQSITLNIAGSGGATVTWTNSLGQSGTGTTISTDVVMNAGTIPMVIAYAISASAGQCSDRKIVEVVVNPEPRLQVTPTSAVYCNIEQVSITATAYPATATVNWTRTPNVPNPPTVSGSGVGSVPISQTLSAGSYVYNFTATAGGCSNTLPATVSVTVQQ